MYFSVRSVVGVCREKLTWRRYFAFLGIGSDAYVTVYAQGSDMYMHACIMNVNDCGSWQLCPNPLHHSAASSTPFLRLLLVAGKVSQKQRRKEEKGGKQTKGRQATLMDSHAVGSGCWNNWHPCCLPCNNTCNRKCTTSTWGVDKKEKQTRKQREERSFI